MPVSILLKKHDFANRNRQPFVANGQTLLDVLRGGFIQTQMLRLRGNVVVSAGTASGTSLGENPGNLLVRAFLDSAPVGQLKSLTPRSLIRSTVFDYGKITGAGTALTGAAGTFGLDLNLYFNFSLYQKRSNNPIDTALESDAFTSLQIRMQNGGRDTQFTGNDRVFDFTAVTWDLVDQREIMAGHTALLFEYDLIKQITGVNSNFNITDFSVGRRLFSQLYAAETTNQQLADTIINRLRVQSGSTTFADGFLLDYRAYNDTWRFESAAASALTGLIHVPLSPDATLGGAIDARQLAQISAVMDVSNPGTDRIVIMARDVLLASDLGLAPA